MSDLVPGSQPLLHVERPGRLAVADAARCVARVHGRPDDPSEGARNPNSAVGLVGANEPLDVSRLRDHCHARSWELRLTALPRSPAGRRAALGRILVTARRTRARWLLATERTLAAMESDHDSSWRALADLLDHLGVVVIAV